MRTVEVSWRDSSMLRGWRSRGEIMDTVHEKDYLDCKTAGYLLEKTDKQICVALNFTDDGGQLGDVMTIPREAVTRIRYLK